MKVLEPERSWWRVAGSRMHNSKIQNLSKNFMTTFVAWVGADSRGMTSMYFASDSRLSWDKDKKNAWDCGQKVYASSVAPEIFGFTGYAVIPQSIISKACQLVDKGLRSPNDEKSIEGRADWLRILVLREAEKHPKIKDEDFTIFYGVRIGHGMPGRSSFHLNTYAWDSKLKQLAHACIPMPVCSAVLKISGTGSDALGEMKKIWDASDQGNTSRTMFSAFCDSLRNGKDPYSGGEPQLVGIYREGPAKIFGVVTENGPSFQGQLDTPLSHLAKIEWRDPLFQRVDACGNVLKKAQRHARPAGV